MPSSDKKSGLQSLACVGTKTAEDLEGIGIHSVRQLAGKNPERLYERLRRKKGGKLDKCVLYLLRCVVYCSSHPNASERERKWWNWKNPVRRR